MLTTGEPTSEGLRIAAHVKDRRAWCLADPSLPVDVSPRDLRERLWDGVHYQYVTQDPAVAPTPRQEQAALGR